MRDQTAAMVVFLTLAPRLPIDPPMTTCDEVTEKWNKWPDATLFVTTDGFLRVDTMPCVNGMWVLADANGWREGIWPKPMIDALVAMCHRYGIVGVS